MSTIQRIHSICHFWRLLKSIRFKRKEGDVLLIKRGTAATRAIVKIVGNVSNLEDEFCWDGGGFRCRRSSDGNAGMTEEPWSVSAVLLSSLLSLLADSIFTFPPTNTFPPLFPEQYLNFFGLRNPSLLLSLLLITWACGANCVVILHQPEHIAGSVLEFPVVIARRSHLWRWRWWWWWWTEIEEVSLRRFRGMAVGVGCGWRDYMRHLA